VNKLNNVKVNYLKFPKSIAGRTKRLRGPHAARVHENPDLSFSSYNGGATHIFRFVSWLKAK